MFGFLGIGGAQVLIGLIQNVEKCFLIDVLRNFIRRFLHLSLELLRDLLTGCLCHHPAILPMAVIDSIELRAFLLFHENHVLVLHQVEVADAAFAD